MSLISNGITSVRAIAIPCGIWPDGTCVEMPRAVLVKWKSILKDVLYQVYINGRYAGTTDTCEQRQMMVSIHSSFTTAVRIEVFAVQPEFADMNLGHELSDGVNIGRIKIIMSRSQNLPIDAIAQIYFDNGTGQIDYENPINENPIKLWPCWQNKSGFGMSKFGFSDFGYDSSAAVGFGKGCFGKDEFGIDADVIEWESPVLSAGVYKFAIVVFDKNGNESIATQTQEITVTPAAEPARALEILSYDKQTKELVLKIT